MNTNRHFLDLRLRTSRLLLGIMAIGLASSSSARVSAQAGFESVDKLFQDFAAANHVPGVAWGIVIDGQLAHAGAAGYREVGTKSSPGADTVFRIASMTKAVTGVAAMQLVEQGKLKLDQPAAEILPFLAWSA